MELPVSHIPTVADYLASDAPLAFPIPIRPSIHDVEDDRSPDALLADIQDLIRGEVRPMAPFAFRSARGSNQTGAKATIHPEAAIFALLATVAQS